jgi:hypothetical protein
MTAAEKWADLNAAVDQAQGTLDRKRQYLERAVRYLDECPDGDPRKVEADRRVQRIMSEYHEAERAAGVAVDLLLDFEDQYPGVRP